ncbi:MAG: PQQ-dependent sugar dehydrogenase [Ardenticatenaceae bacterium]|nr:PQQ-dependent sugar dehydrogenase [Ardenticatenaceae bacterium]
MRKYFLPFLLILTTFIVSCGGADTATPTTPPTAEVAVIEEPTATDTATLAPTATDTAVPATNTPLPEPPTATSPPTSTPTEEPSPTAEEPGPTAVQPDPTADQPQPTAVEANPTAANTPSSPPPPASPGGVEAPTDYNYPANTDVAGWENRIRVPAGFSVKYYGRVEGQPTSIAFSPVDGQLYIAIQAGTIYKMDSAGGISTYAGGYTVPTGIAFRPGTNQLYVSSRVRDENVGGESQVSIVNRGQLIGGLPCCYTYFHAANGIAFGPDGFGYVGVGGRADHGEILDGPNAGQQDELHPLEASILRFNPDTGEVSVYATGFRNPYDIAWDSNGQLWATDNTPDFDPPERLHRVVPGGLHGYPYYDCDVCFSPPPGVTVIPPLATFTPSASPTGVAVYNGSQFPGYNNAIFVALWSSFVGAQKIMHIGAGGSSAPVNFATGFAAPIDVVTGPDGSLYVADWATGIIFQISYTG